MSRGVLLGFLTLLLCTTQLYAFELDTSVVQQTISGIDTLSPTVPGNVAVTAVSLTQLQISWTASSDNIAVAGYVLWRDGVPVATTTLLSFLDGGLASSTAYSYEVQAFDAAENVSAKSAAVVGTTLSPVNTEPRRSEVGTAFLQSMVVTDYAISPQTTTITIRFTTSRFAFTRVSYTNARGDSQEQVSERLATNHEIVLSDLTPDTLYTVDLSVFVDPRFVANQDTLQIRTSPLPDVIPPANVSDLQAIDTGTIVTLTWVNPTDTDLARIRIVRNPYTFPRDLADGWVVHDALDTSFTDNVTTRPVFYAVFAIDEQGNVSSGALAAVRTEQTADSTPLPSIADFVRDRQPSSATGTTEVDRSELTLGPVYIEQIDTVYLVSPERTISLNANISYTVRLIAPPLPGQLRTVIATVQSSENAELAQSFLLRYNETSQAYEALLNPPTAAGQYRLHTSWIDFSTQAVGSYEGQLLFATPEPSREREGYMVTMGLGWFVVGVLMLLWLLRIIWRYTSRNSV